jgi:uncharacterized protein (TIGR02117 family)
MRKIRIFIALPCIVFALYYGILPIIGTGKISLKDKHLVYISSNEIHTAFLFPTNENNPLFTMIDLKDFKPQPIEGIEFSFGDIDFFEKAPTWDKFTFKILIDALFIPDKGLMHVDLYTVGAIAPSNFKKIYLSDDQFAKLIQFIKESFILKNGRPMLYKNLSYYGSDRFYLSTQKYHLFHTCNSWTGDALREINYRTGISTPHKWGVLNHL